jgi:hypothetical protein
VQRVREFETETTSRHKNLAECDERPDAFSHLSQSSGLLNDQLRSFICFEHPLNLLKSRLTFKTVYTRDFCFRAVFVSDVQFATINLLIIFIFRMSIAREGR